MRVTSKYLPHPLISAIKNCPNIDPTIKQEAIKDLMDVLCDKAYFNKVTFHVIDNFYTMPGGFNNISHYKWRTVWETLNKSNCLPDYKSSDDSLIRLVVVNEFYLSLITSIIVDEARS